MGAASDALRVAATRGDSVAVLVRAGGYRSPVSALDSACMSRLCDAVTGLPDRDTSDKERQLTLTLLPQDGAC